MPITLDILAVVLAIAGFGGWAATLVTVTRAAGEAHFMQAKALDLEEQVNARIDKRLGMALQNLRRRREPEAQPGERPAPVALTDEQERARELRRQRASIFESMPDLGEMPMPPLGEMPPAGAEVTE